MRVYNNLFTREDPGADGDALDDLNPDSLVTLQDCRLEPALADAVQGVALQFERQGYFCLDPDSTPEKPVFNRTASLRDEWARIQKQKS